MVYNFARQILTGEPAPFDIYAASEKPIEGVTAEKLAKEIRKHGQREVSYVADRLALPEQLAGLVRPGDIVLTLGAGNIWQAGETLLARLQGNG